jgi:hypothetical protein
MNEKVYLGDGCYATFDGYHIVLTAENGIQATDTICLEPDVLQKLDAYRHLLSEFYKAEQYKPK